MGRYSWIVFLGMFFVIGFSSPWEPGCEPIGGDSQDEITLHFWVGDLSPRTIGFQRALREYERRNPHIRINVQLIPTLGAEGVMDTQKLMCGVAGGAPPDIMEQDRFSIGDWASRGAFMPLDDFISASQNSNAPIREDEFYPACWQEAAYEGKVYAIPNRTDCRALYYNKDILERNNLVDENGEARPPKTWEELKEYNKIISKFKNGHLVQAGFMPLWGNSWLYLFGWQNGGRFMSPDGKTCTLNDPKIAEALQFLVDVYDMLGGREEAHAFESTFQIEAQDAFLTGQVAMRISEDPHLQVIAQYKPNMRFGIAPPPSPEGMPTVTWSGGHSYTIPRGARHPDESWKLIQFLVSMEGTLFQARAQQSYNRSRGRPYVPPIFANRVVAQEVIRQYGPRQESLRTAFQTFLDLMPYSKFRPVTPAGQLLWDSHVKATEDALRHHRSPQEALDYWTADVQRRLDQIYSDEDYPQVDWRMVGMIAVLLLLLSIAALVIHLLRNPLSLARRKEALAAAIFVGPWFLGFIVFMGGPILASAVLSFCNFDVLHPAEFVGLDNYIEMIAQDKVFWISLGNTIYMMIGVPFSLAIGLALALLVNIEKRGTSVFRTLFYLPAIVPVVASSMIWLWILNSRMGLVNIALGWLGLYQPNWLTDELWAKPSIILMLLWGSGASMVIWLAGLKGIPNHLYEAATIDGAGHWGQFRNVTLPMLSPYIFFNLIMGIISTFQIFAQAYIMTSGGPANATLFYVYYIFNQAYKYLRMGYASAMAWILFLIILGLTLLNIKLAPRWVHYEGEQR